MAMQPSAKPFTAPFEPPADFQDPRLQPRFHPKLWPLCNGRNAPRAGTRGVFERRCLEFLAAFYRLNVTNWRLHQARARRAGPAVLRSRQRQVAAAASALSNLEDRYAPIGFFGEPAMEGMLCRNVLFVRPAVPKTYCRPPVQVTAFSIPGLAGIPASELRGRPKLRRLGYAGLDL